MKLFAATVDFTAGKVVGAMIIAAESMGRAEGLLAEELNKDGAVSWNATTHQLTHEVDIDEQIVSYSVLFPATEGPCNEPAPKVEEETKDACCEAEADVSAADGCGDCCVEGQEMQDPPSTGG